MTRRVALAAVFLTSIAGMVAARALGSGPALYDGVCVPVAYASLGANPGPGSVQKTIPASEGEFPTTVISTTEMVPQAQAIFAIDSFPAAALPVTISIAAVQPPAVQPPGGSVTGNVYSFTVKGADGTALQPASGKPFTIALEAPPDSGQSVTVEHFDGSAWSPLPTQVGNCGTLFEAVSPALGDFALVRSGPLASSGGGGSGSGPPIALVVVVVVALVAVVTAVAVTRGRRRGRR